MSLPPPLVQDVLDFLTSHGFARAASALRDDVADRCLIDGSGPPLPPPVRITRGPSSGSVTRTMVSLEASSSSGDFVSMVSSPSDLLNPYGVWSPSRPKSGNSSARHSDFETAREYENPNIFGDSCWYEDQYGDYLKDSFFLPTNSSSFHSEDKFVMSIDAEEKFRQESRNLDVTDKPEINSCCFPLCDCCGGKVVERKKPLNSNSSIYGRYQIMADVMEILDECGEGDFQLKKMDDCREAVVWKSNSLYEQNLSSDISMELGTVRNEAQMNDTYSFERGDQFDYSEYPEHGRIPAYTDADFPVDGADF